MTGNTENRKQILQDIIHLKEMLQAGPASLASGPASGSSAGKESSLSSGSPEQAAGLMAGTPFSEPMHQPTQKGPKGIRYDFNAGIRVSVPAGEWRIRLKDTQTETLIYETIGNDIQIGSRKRHFLQARIEVEQNGKLVLAHDFNAAGKKVAILFPAGTIGDTLGWFPYALRFAHKHACELHVVMSAHMRALLEPVHPDVHFHLKEEFDRDEALRRSLYATYYLGLFFQDEDNIWQPSDFRLVGLHRTAGHILGVDPTEEPPVVAIDTPDSRPIEEPYVVVAVQASSGCKLWHNPLGWLDTVAFLRKQGYRVICIDMAPITGFNLSWNALPHGVEDETGNRPLSERARWLKHADFFVGLSSGLSWLAWAVGTPVVMISGFTHPHNEFHTPYRVFSTHTCNSCWHDVRTPFEHDNYMFCPRHKNTPRQFECTRLISSGYVVDTIHRLCEDHGFLPLSGRRASGRKTSSRRHRTGKSAS